MSYYEEDSYKIFNDPVHGSIELHPLCVKIIDTPQFQRMRNIKQLGFCYFVYSGASHNRFEHSIGTCHLASLMVKNLQQRQPELNISKKDRLCVEIAGLCHDLGHGPFSHVFDQKFLPSVSSKNSSDSSKNSSDSSKNSSDSSKNNWKHEEGSVKMFDCLYENIKEQFKQAGLDEKDKTFIKNLINPSNEIKDDFEITARGKDKGFLYEIISNKENGIDVDKWDYFARDCHHLGIKNNFDHLRLMKFAKVITSNDEHTNIAYREKTVENIYNMFHLRRCLHKKAYQHKIVNIISTMFVDALQLADKHITRIGSDGEKWIISDSIGDMKAYLQFTDNIFEEILYSTSEKEDMKKSKKILEKIIQRDLPTFIGEAVVRTGTKSEIIKDFFSKKDSEVAEQLIVCVTDIDYGCKSNNPVDKVKFYSKDGKIIESLPQNMISHMLPKTFAETCGQVFVKDPSFKEKAREVFMEWQNSLKTRN